MVNELLLNGDRPPTPHLGVELQKDRVLFREYDHSNYFRCHHFLLLFVSLQRRLAEVYAEVSQDYSKSTLIGFRVQRLLTTWNDLSSRSPFTVFSEEVAPYMLFGNCTCQFKVLPTHSENLSPL